MNSIPHPPSAHHPAWRDLLHARGLTDHAIDRAGLHANGRGWLYPVAPDLTVQRWKAYPGEKGAKYLWKPTKPADARFYDPRGDLADHIAAAGGTLILCEGEPDVWACWSAGIYNATATMHGAGNVPAWFASELQRLVVRHVLIWPDRDDAGQQYAIKLREALAGCDISLEARELPKHLGKGGDINALLLDVGPARLYSALEACPALELREAKPSPPPAPETHVSAPSEAISDHYERWCLEVEAEAVRAWQIAPPNAKQLSRKNFSSPFREDRNPSAQWNYATHGFKDYGTGEFYSTHIVADLLNFEPWTEWRARQAPVARAAAPVMATRFPLGLPYTLNKRYLNAHRRVNVKPQTAAAAVDYLYHQIPRDMLPDEHWFSAGGFRQIAHAAGFAPTPHLCTTGLDALAPWGRIERLEVERIEWLDTPEGAIGKKCNLYTSTQQVYRLRFLVVPSSGPAPKVVYRFRPWPESLDAIDRRWRALTREGRYADTPDDVQPEWGDLTDAEVALWDDWRAPLYVERAAAREQAAEKHARDLAYLEADFARIRAGSYNPVILPADAKIESAPRYADALKAARVAAAGEKGISTYRLIYETGRSYSAEVRARERAQVVAVPQKRTIPAEQVTDYQRACGLVLEEHDGQAIVKAPSVEKLRAHATPDELAAAETLSNTQRVLGTRSAEARRRGVREVEPAPQFHVQESQTDRQPDTIPAGYSEAHVQAQYDMKPLPPEFKPYDTETGELYEPRHLWKEGARWLAARQALATEESEMTTFVERSQPIEKSNDDRREDRKPRRRVKTAQRPAEEQPERRQEDPERHAPRAYQQGRELHSFHPAETATSYQCQVCGSPAAHLHFLGWYCDQHIGLPLAEKIARP